MGNVGGMDDPNRNLYCFGCGYNLRGLSGDPRRCPECAKLNAMVDLEVPAEMINRTLRRIQTGPALSTSAFVALILWLLAHVLDNCDGDLARALDEARPEWGQLDILLHAWGNMIFWPILGFLTGSWQIVTLILALRVIMEHHRGRFQMVGNRFGEKSQLWMWVAHPTNINIMYTAYVPFALAGQLEWYLYGYLGYYFMAALGQGIAFTLKVKRLK